MKKHVTFSNENTVYIIPNVKYSYIEILERREQLGNAIQEYKYELRYKHFMNWSFL